MTREDIIRIALDVGIFASRDWLDAPFAEDIIIDLERFAGFVAAEEREACAKVCDTFQERNVGMQPAECAGAIRARGEASIKGNT